MHVTHLIVAARQEDLLAAAEARRAHRRPFPFGVMRGARVLRRAPRRVAPRHV
jgi:hypothetical protein